MKVAVHYFSKKFKCSEEETPKECYLKVCRWVAEHLIGVQDLDDTYWKVKKEKDPQTGRYEFKLELYAMLDEEQSRDSFCNACKDFHKRFYINSDYNCSRCNMNARVDDLRKKLLIKKDFRKERLQYMINKKQK